MKTTKEIKIANFILSVFEDNGLSYSRDASHGVEAIEDMKTIQDDLENLKWRIVTRAERIGKPSGFLSQLMTIQEQFKLANSMIPSSKPLSADGVTACPLFRQPERGSSECFQEPADIPRR